MTPPSPTALRGAGKHVRIIAGGLALGVGLLGTQAPVWAAVGGDARAQALTTDLLGTVPDIVDLSLQAGTEEVAAPTANGVNDDATGLDVQGLGTDLDVGLLTATAERNPDNLTAFSSLDGLNLSVLGASVLSVEAVNSAVTCPVEGTMSTETEILGLSVGGEALTLEANASAQASASVEVEGLVDASVEVSLTSPTYTTATEAGATGLVADLTLTGTTGEGELISVPLGSIVLAASTCERPTSADAVAPVLTSLTPTEGPLAGGQLVTIIGENFEPDSIVSFGTTPATDVTVVSPTEITVLTPPGTDAGIVQVTVTTSAGPSGPLAYTYQAAPAPVPTLLTITPDEGPIAGGQLVTITGTGFEAGAVVTFNEKPGTDVIVLSPTTLSVFTPPGDIRGLVNVVVTTTAGPSLPLGYTYFEAAVPAPTLLALTPNSGPLEGNQLVTITGENFDATTTVAFGTNPATDVTVVSPTQLTVRTPAGVAAGAVDVRVATNAGSSDALPYTYLEDAAAEAPVLSAVTPNEGPLVGGQGVTLTGENFVPGTTVTFGGVPATNVTVVSPTQLTLTTPAGVAPGAVDVVATTPAGVSGALPYTYLEEVADESPALSDVTPDEGPLGGGQSVTLTGGNFTPDATVTFGGVPATNVVVTSPNELTLTTPAGVAPGAVDVVVTTPDGVSGPLPYTYLAAAPDDEAPVVTSVTPNTGPVTGGQSITLIGENFVPGTTVTFDGVPATNVTVVSPTQLTLTTPAGVAPGAADIVVTTPEGSATFTEGYVYTAVPVVTPDPTPVTPDPTPVTPDPVVSGPVVTTPVVQVPLVPVITSNGTPRTVAVQGTRNTPVVTRTVTTNRLAQTGTEAGALAGMAFLLVLGGALLLRRGERLT